jgi:hypothetical protein
MRSTQYARSIPFPSKQPLTGQDKEAIESGSIAAKLVTVLSNVSSAHTELCRDAAIASVATFSEIGRPVT